ncbi:DUF4269 domain-containing protein [Pedobacter agri]|uniref:DUF4269 domain-containing protein n=1 Tax=Pedobacter agri TaxID=454586 RepID=A0A9X3DDZ4_9SPHI|nr:DUF4269 domain-containing protein [Pedobacter agri]MCX3265892.1 DUF4269 domain-containing protein [Pedobacter agri]
MAFILSGLLTLDTARNKSCMVPNLNFLDIAYLENGNERQKNAYQVLTENAILEKLNRFTPILVGTIPINIDIESSDLDIICYAPNQENFIQSLNYNFGKENQFIISKNTTFNSVKANFFTADFEIEIFGQDIPTQQQNAYRHMLIEYKILLEKGENFRLQVIELKRQGYKTEPAFAKLLGLQGDPYEELLELQF